MEYEEIEFFDGEIDENYEPSMEEIQDYAKFLGMNLVEDQDLLYIAREGLKAPLPAPWKACKLRNEEICYFNPETEEYQADHPLDAYFRSVYQHEKELKIQKKRQNSGPSHFKAKFSEKLNMQSSLNALSNDILAKNVKNSTSNQVKKLENPVTNLKNIAFKNKANNNLEGEFMGNINNFVDVESLSLKSIEEEPANLINTNQTKSIGKNFLKANDDVKKHGNIKKIDDDYDKIDKEYDTKWLTIQKIKEKEMEHFNVELKNNIKDIETNLTNTMNHELELLKKDLNISLEDVKLNLLKENELIRKNLIDEYEKKYQKESIKLKEENILLLRNMDAKENTQIELELQNYESKLKHDYEVKKLDLIRQKKEFELKFDKNKRDEEILKTKMIAKFDNEKQDIINDYEKLLVKFENEQTINQKEEIENYIKQLENKIQKEKTAIVDAYNQKLIGDMHRQQEIKESFNKEFEKETDRLDLSLMKSIKEYEEELVLKKDVEIKKLQYEELKIQKGKKEMAFQQQKQEIKQNLAKRLESYKSALRDKTEVEKLAIKEQMTNLLEKYKEHIKSIELDHIQSREDLFMQINQLEANNINLKNEIQYFDLIIQNLRNENKNYQEKLDIFHKQSGQSFITPLKQPILQHNTNENSDKTRFHVYLTEPKIETSEKRHKDRKHYTPNTRKNNNNISLLLNSKDKLMTEKNDNDNTIILSRLINEVSELKSIILNKDDQEQQQDNLKNSYSMSNHSELKKKRQNKAKIFNTIDDWRKYCINQIHELDQLKEELHQDKIIIKKTQDYLRQEQKKYEENYNKFKQLGYIKDDKTIETLNEMKENINDQVRKLNKDINLVRQNEFLIKSKEKILKNMENAINEFKNQDIDKLMNILNEYNELEFEYKSPQINQYHRIPKTSKNKGNIIKETDYFTRKSKNLRNNDFNNIIPDSHFKNDEDITDINKKSANMSMFEFSNSQKDLNDSIYNNDHFLDISDTKHKIKHIDQKEFSYIWDNREKANLLFKQHSLWLKKIKNELNSQIYSQH